MPVISKWLESGEKGIGRSRPASRTLATQAHALAASTHPLFPVSPALLVQGCLVLRGRLSRHAGHSSIDRSQSTHGRTLLPRADWPFCRLQPTDLTTCIAIFRAHRVDHRSGRDSPVSSLQPTPSPTSQPISQPPSPIPLPAGDDRLGLQTYPGSPRP